MLSLACNFSRFLWNAKHEEFLLVSTAYSSQSDDALRTIIARQGMSLFILFQKLLCFCNMALTETVGILCSAVWDAQPYGALRGLPAGQQGDSITVSGMLK
jgi:hypothetical protein